MRFSSRTWSLLSLLLFVAAVFFWLKGNEVRDRKRNAAPANARTTNQGARLDLLSTSSLPVQIAQLGQGSSSPQNKASSTAAPARPHPFHLNNTGRAIDQLMRDDHALLLVNAFIDTTARQPLEIPAHLRSEQPSSYIVQAKGMVNSVFRKALEQAGVEVVAYVPNNAYLVNARGINAENLRALREVHAVVPFEPYFKIDRRLLRLAVNQELLPDDASLRLTLFPGERENALNALQSHIIETIAEEPSPFGPQVIVRPQSDSLTAIAQIGAVQAIEPDLPRSPASDLTRVALGISANTETNVNWLGLTGSNIWVNMNDVTVETNHPALSGRVFAGHPDVKSNDVDGHGTFVASLIVGDGSNPPSNVQGSTTNADFRGMAHEAKILALPIESGIDTQARVLDTYLTETAARSNYFTLKRTNSLISNNSWNYVGAAEYDSAAARYDAATRDSIPGETGEQPVLFVFAAGNGGFGDDNGLSGTSGSIYSPGTAKNVITVGALEHPRFITNFYTITNVVVEDDGFTVTNVSTNYVFLDMTDSSDQVASFSSRGNVDAGFEGIFGRFKPDVVAPGTMLVSARSSGWSITNEMVVTNEPGKTFKAVNDSIGTEYRYDSGSTYAAATVSGMLALIQEFFERKAADELRTRLSPALMKGLLINGSRSLTASYDLNPNSLINYQGWGLPGLARTLPIELTNKTAQPRWPVKFMDQHPTNALATGQSRIWNVTLGTNASFYPLRLTLVWTDPPGNPLVGVKLVNDLDLVVTNLESGVVWHGNYIISGSDYNQPISSGDAITLDTAFDRVNNVENIFIQRPQDFGRKFSVTVAARRVNVNAVHNYQPTQALNNDIVQDFALVISSDISTGDPLNTEDVFEELSADDILATRYNKLLSLTNGLPLLNERIGANAVLVGTNGITNQWNFYVFTNKDTPNSFATTSAGTNVAFVTFNPPNLASPARNVEADIDLYVSKDSRLTNLEPAVLDTALKSVERGGTETIVLSNAVINDVFYIAVKAEDQQGAEFSLMGISSDGPFEEDINGRKVLHAVPLTGFVPDGSALQPAGNTMIAIGITPRRILKTVADMVVSHEDLGDLVGILRHGPNQVVLNNHTLNDGNFRGTNIVLTYDDSPYSVQSPTNQFSDGPGSLNDFVGDKLNGPWILNMIDNAPGHTGRVERLTIWIDPMQDPLLSGVVVSGTNRNGEMTVYPIDVPPGAVNLNVRMFDVIGGSLDVYLNKDNLPTTNSFLYTTSILPPGGEFNYGQTNQPALSAGSWYLGLRNPLALTVSFKLVILFEYDFNSNNSKDLVFTGPQLVDDATTNQVFTINDDKVITSAEVSVHLPHPRISDMALRLVSPQGTPILLAEERGSLSTSGYGGLIVYTNSAGDRATNKAFTVFTENTNLAVLPLKFASPPYFDPSTNIGILLTNGFERATNGNYFPGAFVDGWLVGGTNSTNNQIVVPAQVSVWSNPALAHTGTNFLSLGTGLIERDIVTVPGKIYRLKFAYRSGLSFPLYNTGLNNDRSPRLPAQPELHYSLRGTRPAFEGPLSYIMAGAISSPWAGYPFPIWMANTPTSQWIAPYPRFDLSLDSGQTHFYSYTTYISTYGYRPNSSVDVRLAADNNLTQVTLNGNPLISQWSPDDSYSRWPLSLSLGPLVQGINVLTVTTRDFGDPAGFRLETTSERLLRLDPRATNNSTAAFLSVEGVETNFFSGGTDWRVRTFDFIARDTNTLLTFGSQRGEMFLDTVTVQSSGDGYFLPEEPLALLTGERALGDWSLELVDQRTGATSPLPALTEWKLNLTYAEPNTPAQALAPGTTFPVPTQSFAPLYTNNVHYFYVDTCPDTTRATITLVGLTNIGGLELLVDRSGLPTGDPETDDYVLARNTQVPSGSTNGFVTLTISTTSPASAPLVPGKRLYFAVQNRLIARTNLYTLKVDLDRASCISRQSTSLAAQQSVTSTLSQALSAQTEGELFSHTVTSPAQSLNLEAFSTTGDLQILVSKDVLPTRQSYTYSANASTSGFERLEINSQSSTPLQQGTYYVLLLNNSPDPLVYSLELERGFAPLITSSQVVDGQFQLSFTSVAGAQYQVQASSDLENWTPLTTITANSSVTTYSTSEMQTAQFFRVVQQ